MTKEEFKNLKVGEKFNIGYRSFEVKKGNGSSKDCLKCYFNAPQISSCSQLIEEDILPYCVADNRQDEEYVYFEEIENDKNKSILETICSTVGVMTIFKK